MSMKSFDKFCESIIMNDPKSRKEIFDERQKIVRKSIYTEALIGYSTAVFLNTLIMEGVYQWCESHVAPMLALALAAVIYCEIRCAVKGVLIAVNGTFSRTFSGVYCIFMGSVLGATQFLSAVEEWDKLVKDGMVTRTAMLILVLFLCLIYGVLSIVLTKRERKKREDTE